MHAETHTWVQGSTSEWERSHKPKTRLFGQDVSLQISFLVTCELSKRNYPIANNRVPFTAPQKQGGNQTEPVEAKMCCHIRGFFVMDRQTIFSTIRSSSWVRMARSGRGRQREDTSETTVLWWKDVESLWYCTARSRTNTHRIHVCHIWQHLPSIYPSHVSIYTSTMDPIWDMKQDREEFFPPQDALAAAHVTTTLPATGLVASE